MSHSLQAKHIVLGVCGGIAAYKAVELLRLLVKQGADVRVVMTRHAGRFVGPLTFEALCRRPAWVDLFDGCDEAAFRHIEWAEAADAVVVAPATANVLGKLAGGIADDALTTFMLAVTAPVLLCPSMNSRMYANPAVQRNLTLLEEYGYHIIAPDQGELACGTSGPGRLPEPVYIADRLVKCLTPQDLTGRRILVTAGPTWEPLDPVRFLSNRSSGKMGFAVAAAAEKRGAKVSLITGPTHLADPFGVEIKRVTTAAEMADAVSEQMPSADIVVKAAAVSDYRPASTAVRKIKKSRARLDLPLEKNPDILATLGGRKTSQFLVGFAAETESLAENAAGKLAAKNLDIIAGNLVGSPGSGFGSDNNKITLFYRDGSRESLPEMTKADAAHVLLDRIRQRCHPQRGAGRNDSDPDASS